MNASVRPSPVELACDPETAEERIGLLVLATDLTTEGDFARMCRPVGVNVYTTRVAFSNPFTADSLRAMRPRLAEAARLILPGSQIGALAYSCTAASVLIGDDVITAALREGRPEVPVVTPISGALAAFEVLAVRTVSVLAPYTTDVAAALGQCFERHGTEVSKLTALGMDDDAAIARLGLDTLIEAAEEADDPRADALFLSCTALRAVQVAQRIEDRLGKPVVTSNQAMCWRTLRAAGCMAQVHGFGRLPTLPANGHRPSASVVVPA